MHNPIEWDPDADNEFQREAAKGLWKGICWALFITGLAIGIVTTLIKMI